MQSTGPILELKGVTVSFDGFRVLDDLDFSIGRGELRFLIGPNGAGKTTLLDCMTGRTHPDRGQIWFDGLANAQRRPEHVLVQRGIARKFQTPAIFNSLTVAENLETAISFRDPTARLLRPLSTIQQERVVATMSTIGLERRAGIRAGTLSHGEQQWLEIGLLLVQDPKLLLLDEPIAGMTRRERDRTGELVQAIARERSVLVVEHDMEFVRRYAATVSVLHAGKLLMEGSIDQVQRDPRVIQVYLGRAAVATKPQSTVGGSLQPQSTTLPAPYTRR